jgi:hypothetical protein
MTPHAAQDLAWSQVLMIKAVSMRRLKGGRQLLSPQQCVRK